MKSIKLICSLACAAAFAGASVAHAHHMNDDCWNDGNMGMGPGMMGGQGMMGQGMMGGQGMGPGMMGGQGMGPGMMGGQGMGPGMMGGQGMGPGMMGGQGMGRGMMGGQRMAPGMIGRGMQAPDLDLSDQQRSQIDKIRIDARKKQYQLAKQMRAENRKLQALYDADKPDHDAIRAERKKIQDLRLQMMQSWMTAQNDMDDVLTDEQREELHDWRWQNGLTN